MKSALFITTSTSKQAPLSAMERFGSKNLNYWDVKIILKSCVKVEAELSERLEFSAAAAPASSGLG